MQDLIYSIDTFLSTLDLNFKWILIILNFITLTGVYIHRLLSKPIRENKILFLIAHPDDQCMFFKPTITNLRESYIVHVLCLTGKNEEREKQLRQSCKYLKVDSVQCLQIQGIVDGMDQIWDTKAIKNVVLQYVKNNQIKAIFTFDKFGVSGHKNHIAVHNAVKQLQVKTDHKGCIKVYYLQTVNILRKYLGALQLLIALLKTYSWMELSTVSNFKCMSAHKSQFVWYRKLWVLFSRYLYVNSYQRSFLKIYEENQIEAQQKKQKLQKQKKQKQIKKAQKTE